MVSTLAASMMASKIRMMLMRGMADMTQAARTTASKMQRVRWRVRRDGISIRRMAGRTMLTTTTASKMRLFWRSLGRKRSSESVRNSGMLCHTTRGA